MANGHWPSPSSSLPPPIPLLQLPQWFTSSCSAPCQSTCIFGSSNAPLPLRPKLKVFQRVPWQVEVLSYCSVKVVPSCSPVLRATLPAPPRVAHLDAVLRAVMAPASTVVTSNSRTTLLSSHVMDLMSHVSLFALLLCVRLSSQVDATQAVGIAAPSEASVGPAAGAPPPVHRRQHQHVPQVERPLVGNQRCPRHPLPKRRAPLHWQLVRLLQT